MAQLQFYYVLKLSLYQPYFFRQSKGRHSLNSQHACEFLFVLYIFVMSLIDYCLGQNIMTCWIKLEIITFSDSICGMDTVEKYFSCLLFSK